MPCQPQPQCGRCGGGNSTAPPPPTPCQVSEIQAFINSITTGRRPPPPCCPRPRPLQTPQGPPQTPTPPIQPPQGPAPRPQIPIPSEPPQPQPLPPPSQSPPDQEFQPFMDMLNKERVRLGCAPLELSPYLSVAAKRHSQDMLDRNYMAHIAPEPSPYGTLPRDRIHAAGFASKVQNENVAQGSSTQEGTYQQWFKSPGHYATMTDCKYNSIGIGQAGTYWTTTFAKGTDAEFATGPVPNS